MASTETIKLIAGSLLPGYRSVVWHARTSGVALPTITGQPIFISDLLLWSVVLFSGKHYY